MNRQKANTILLNWLVGSYIDKLTYYITGWELTFLNTKHSVQSVFSEIRTLKPLNWNDLIQNAPLNIENTNEHVDTLTSIVLFTALNKHSVITAEIDIKNNLIIEFKNETKILIPSITDVEDWTWILVESSGESIKCERGEILLGNLKQTTT